MRTRARWVLAACFAFASVVTLLLWAMAFEARRLFNVDTLKSRLVAEMSRELDSDVSLDRLELGVFPVLRLRGFGLVVEPRHESAGHRVPTITARAFTVKPGWRNLVHGRAGLVEVEGLEITIPPRRASVNAGTPSPKPTGPIDAARAVVPIDRVVATNSDVIFIRSRPDQPPRVYHLHELSLTAVAADNVMRFRATLSNPIPAGRIDLDGRLGPWNAAAPAETFIEGDYTYTDADFDTIDGLGGTLSSTGHFQGPLARLAVNGSSTMPDFQLDRSGHAAPLATVFQATVDTGNGDVRLDRVEATLGATRIIASGTVTTTPGVNGHLIGMQFSVPQGRVEDLLMLTLPAPRPMLTGSITLSAMLRLPPGPGRVVDRLRVDHGRFSLTGVVFTTAEIQSKVDSLSHRGLGLPHDQATPAVSSAFDGQFTLANGLVTLPEFSFIVPGARVGLAGNYQLGGGEMDFQGELKMAANLSRVAGGGGVKSFLLTAVDPVFQQSGSAHGVTLPIRIMGTHEHPAFKLDFRRLMKGQGRE